MNLLRQKLIALGIVVSTLVLVTSGTASAHVVVKPEEVLKAGFETFTIGATNERDVPMTSLRLVIPEGLKYVTPTQKTGWKIGVDKAGEGDYATVKSITWSENNVAVGFRDEFTFSAKVPNKTTQLQWKAYQTYEDGTVVSWDQADESEKEGSNKGPYSVTRVVSETNNMLAGIMADQKAGAAQNSADRAIYLAGAALIVGLLAIFLITRKKSS